MGEGWGEGKVQYEDPMRFGHGFDAHAFEENRKLILCGVEIPHEKGLAGHSDADVGIHALCDALLGAAALGDIGKHFPATAEYKNIDSRLLLRKVISMLSQNGYRLNNADITLIAQDPKLAPHIEKMRSIVAEDTQTDLSSINIKATTTDGLGFTGRKEGIAAHAVVSLIKP